MTALNTYRLGEPGNVSQAVGLSIGAASVCWESLSEAGMFDSDRANKIADDLVAYIETHYEPKSPEAVREALQRRDPEHPPIPGL